MAEKCGGGQEYEEHPEAWRVGRRVSRIQEDVLQLGILQVTCRVQAKPMDGLDSNFGFAS